MIQQYGPDLILISSKTSIVKRCRSISDDFKVHHLEYDSVDHLIMTKAKPQAKCFILDCTNEPSRSIPGYVKSIRYLNPNAFIVAIIKSKVTSEELDSSDYSGVSVVVLESDFFESSRVDFIISQILRSSYIPVKVGDLYPHSSVNCPLYLIMPYNQKFVKFYSPNTQIDERFLDKYIAANEIYIQRDDLDIWSEYIQNNTQRDQEASFRIGRIKFLQLHYEFINLALMLTDQTTKSTFAKGNQQLQQVLSFSSSLSDIIAAFPDPWEFINNSSVGDFGSVERGAAVAAYASLIAQRVGVDDLNEIILSALLADVGCLLFPPEISRKIRAGNFDELRSEEMQIYCQHPVTSLNQCLAKKLQLSEVVKTNIIQSHERLDKRGFPNQVAPGKICLQAMIIKLATELDAFMQVRMGTVARKGKDIKESFVPSTLSQGEAYPYVLMELLTKIFN